MENQSRDKIIIRISIIGIAANVLLAAFKAVIGLMSGSIAIVLDAVNNISDAASSVITIVGTKLAGKAPDKKHPFGYGRIEYLSAMIIALIVLYAGITSFTESVKQIIHPEVPDYRPVMLVIVAAGVIVKILLGRYVKGVGEKVNSDSLVNSGEDATLDSIISASTLVAAIIYMTAHVSLEAWLGAIISIVIIKSGIEMLRDTLSQILGERADIQLAKDIKKTVLSFPEVKGAYDLVLHNYGPDRFTGSIHVEIPDTMTVNETDELIRAITRKVLKENQVVMTAITIYAANSKDSEIISARKTVTETAMSHPNVLQVHGFYMNKAEKEIRFDMVVSFDEKDRMSLCKKIREEIQAKFPDYTVTAVLDTDFTEE